MQKVLQICFLRISSTMSNDKVDEWYSRYLELQINNPSVGCLYHPDKDKKVLLEKLSEKSGMCH
jgi:hypothetical protein